jgi:hypothetical protein
MRMCKGYSLATMLAILAAATPVGADDIRQESDAQPMADEKCIEKCDIQSDQCMQSAEGDPAKLQACDDRYSECLRACEAG